MGKKNKKNFYNEVVEANEGIQVKDVKEIFLWYDLLSCLLPFQLIFILTYALGSNQYLLTACSIFFILITDSTIKILLQNDGKKFVNLKKQLVTVKIWVVPLAVMVLATVVCLFCVNLGVV